MLDPIMLTSIAGFIFLGIVLLFLRFTDNDSAVFHDPSKPDDQTNVIKEFNPWNDRKNSWLIAIITVVLFICVGAGLFWSVGNVFKDFSPHPTFSAEVPTQTAATQSKVIPTRTPRSLEGSAEFLYRQGESYRRSRKYEEAIDLYTYALEADPNLFEAYQGRADVYKRLKKYELAIADYERALQIDPSSTHCAGELLGLYAHLDQRDKIADLLNWLISIDPDTYCLWASAYDEVSCEP